MITTITIYFLIHGVFIEKFQGKFSYEESNLITCTVFFCFFCAVLTDIGLIRFLWR